MFTDDDRCRLTHVEAGIRRLEWLLWHIAQREERLMATVQDILTSVQDESTVEDSVITLLTAIKTQLDAAVASGNPQAVQAVLDQLVANKKKLADAVVANTPAA